MRLVHVREVIAMTVLAATVLGIPSARVAPAADTTGTAIRPFRVHFTDEELAELRRRILATQWPDKETVGDLSQGVPLATMRELARHGATDYDMSRVKNTLNAFPQFITAIDGLDIHFIHVRSKHSNALPLLISHGWPGSVLVRETPPIGISSSWRRTPGSTPRRAVGATRTSTRTQAADRRKDDVLLLHLSQSGRSLDYVFTKYAR